MRLIVQGYSLGSRHPPSPMCSPGATQRSSSDSSARAPLSERARTLTSYGDVHDPVARPGLDVSHIDGQAALNGLVEIGQQLLERVAFRGATRDGGDLSPESAFVGLVNHDLQSHGDLLVAVPHVVCSSATSIASGARTCAQEVSTQAIEHTCVAAAIRG